MSDDNLESLDNASLRKKCLEFGLPNVPITDTSRKLLIRKLRVAMNGEVDDKKKNRRETIHVTKIPSLVESNVNAVVEDAPKRPPSRINRRTIAATSVTSTVDDTSLPESSRPEPITERRRSVRAQAETEAPAPVIAVSQKRKTAAVLAEEDEDDDDVILLEAAEQSEREIIIPRGRRSVSLSKTGVVTTSYSQETVAAPPPPPTVNETESESEYDFTSKYASLYEPIARPLTQSQPLMRDTSYGLSEPKVVVEPDNQTLSFRTTSVNSMSIEPEKVYNKPSLPAASRYSSLGSGYSSNTASSITTSTTRRYTSGGYGTTNTPAPKYSSMYDDQEENDENQPETPYLSDFARKLERLKAEPLVKGAETPRNVPMKRETQRFHSSISGRRSTMQTDSVADSFKNFLFALDRKYKLKRNFSILFVVILILFIYIVFIN
ncbi:otefin-like [Eupeodes corollae]|uniref:otefin-like n=1 Tax=Eupeodes corollae TaxID=290404 RepID=UPI002491A7C3|nr:otefin-like [Eupeodes corollae]